VFQKTVPSIFGNTAANVDWFKNFFHFQITEEVSKFIEIADIRLDWSHVKYKM